MKLNFNPLSNCLSLSKPSIFSTPVFIWLVLSLFWMLLTGVVIVTRPLLPIMETRYVSIAWEMWVHHHYLFPIQNGLPYADKPPLLFWLILTGWHIFGVNEWWPRILPAIFGYLDAVLLYLIARELWPQRQDIGLSCFIMLLGSMAWAIYANIVLFDIVLSVWILLAIYGLCRIYIANCCYGWIYWTLGIGFGLLTKGPIVLIFVLVPSLIIPWFIPRKQSLIYFYAGLSAFFIISVLIGLAWAIPAMQQAGHDYADAILIQQTIGRILPNHHLINHSHSHPFWWYLKLLPLYLAPWLLFLPFYSQFSVIRRNIKNPNFIFLLVAVLIIFVIMSMIGGKQIQYLLPLIPFGILCLAYLMTDDLTVNRSSLWLYNFTILTVGIALGFISIWVKSADHTLLAIFVTEKAAWVIIGYAIFLFLVSCSTCFTARIYLSLSSIGLIMLLHIFVINNGYAYYNAKPLAVFIHDVQQQKQPVAFWGEYQDQFQFLGRLQSSLAEVNSDNWMQWVSANPEGWVLLNQKQMQTLHLVEGKQFFYQGRIVSMVKTTVLNKSISEK